MPVLKMDGTVRKKRAPKRTTEALPHWCDAAFVQGYHEGVAAKSGKPIGMSYDAMTPWVRLAGYKSGIDGFDKKQAEAALDEACAQRGFHRF